MLRSWLYQAGCYNLDPTAAEERFWYGMDVCMKFDSQRWVYNNRAEVTGRAGLGLVIPKSVDGWSLAYCRDIVCLLDQAEGWHCGLLTYCL